MKKKNIRKSVEFVINNYEQDIFDGKKAYEAYVAKNGILRIPNKQNKRLNLKVISFVAASITAIAFILLSVINNDIHVVSMDKKIEVIMPDSSKIVLYPNSSISYNKNSYITKERIITIDSGKVYFDVKENTNKAFIVECDRSTTMVTGTSFQISQNSNGVSIYVETGSVDFSHKESGKYLSLTKGMSALLPNELETPQIINEPLPNPLVWVTGVFIYKNTPLSIVAMELSKYYGVNIRIDNNEHVLTAEFKDNELNEIIDVIETVFNINVYVNE